MLSQMFVIYDLKSSVHTSPFAWRTKGEAIRNFTDSAKDPNSMISKHPADFQLKHVGTFNIETGVMIPSEPVVLGTADQYLN